MTEKWNKGRGAFLLPGKPPAAKDTKLLLQLLALQVQSYRLHLCLIDPDNGGIIPGKDYFFTKHVETIFAPITN